MRKGFKETDSIVLFEEVPPVFSKIFIQNTVLDRL